MSQTWIVPQAQRVPTRHKYRSNDVRVKPVELLVMHYTVGAFRPLLPAVKNWAEGDELKSTHLVIARDPRVEKTLQMASLTERTWHAGGSSWRGKSNINAFSIGVDVDNLGWLLKKDGKWIDSAKRPYKGPTPFIDEDGMGWEPYTEESIKELCRVVNILCEEFPIIRTEQDRIVGHEHVRPTKRDPGPAFPWELVQLTARTGDYPGKPKEI